MPAQPRTRRCGTLTQNVQVRLYEGLEWVHLPAIGTVAEGRGLRPADFSAQSAQKSPPNPVRPVRDVGDSSVIVSVVSNASGRSSCTPIGASQEGPWRESSCSTVRQTGTPPR